MAPLSRKMAKPLPRLFRYWGYVRRPIVDLLVRRSSLPVGWVSSWVYAYILVAFWRAVYGPIKIEAGFTLPQIVSYVVAGQVIGSFFRTTALDRLTTGVEKGTIILDLLKPVRLPFLLLADAFGAVIAAFLSQGIPMLVFGVLVFHMTVVTAPATIGMLLLLVLLGSVLRQIMDGMIAYSAFWTVRAEGLDRLAGWVVFSFLGGSFVPYSFFPAWAQGILSWSPLAGLYSDPLQVWVGRMSFAQGFHAAGLDALWIVGLGALAAWIHSRAMRHVLSFGG